jgi:hypothetical protein
MLIFDTTYLDTVNKVCFHHTCAFLTGKTDKPEQPLGVLILEREAFRRNLTIASPPTSLPKMRIVQAVDFKRLHEKESVHKLNIMEIEVE